MQAEPPCFRAWEAPRAQLGTVQWPLSFPSQDYYGKELQKTEDLKTNVCVTSARPLSKVVRDALERIHEEVVAR